ncbi:MAG: VWA domain-containing protein [Lysobacteraceae bacterium]
MLDWLVSSFDWPWLVLALPLPWLLRRLLPAVAGSGVALRIPFLDEIATAIASGARRSTRPPLLAWLVWGLLVLAAMRPVSLGEPTAPPTTGRDLLLAVDVSGSMAAEDMQVGRQSVSRLTAVKAVLGDFLERRVGDRLGLLLFGQRAYLVTPLTLDRDAVKAQLLDSQVGIAGRETAIGDAIGLAVKRLRDRPQEQRVLILLTDGVNTAGALEPERAAELAKAENVRVYTIGMGSDRSGGLFGMAFSTNTAEIDEAGLKAIARETGGRYFRARDTAELAGIYAEMDRLEPALLDAEPLRPRHELFVWPLAAALLLAMAGLLFSVVGGRRENVREVGDLAS